MSRFCPITAYWLGAVIERRRGEGRMSEFLTAAQVKATQQLPPKPEAYRRDMTLSRRWLRRFLHDLLDFQRKHVVEHMLGVRQVWISIAIPFTGRSIEIATRPSKDPRYESIGVAAERRRLAQQCLEESLAEEAEGAYLRRQLPDPVFHFVPHDRASPEGRTRAFGAQLWQAKRARSAP